MKPVRFFAARGSAASRVNAACVAVFTMVLASGFSSKAEGAALDDVIGSLEAAQGRIFESMEKYRQLDPDAARILLEEALADLADVQVDLQDTALAEQLGRNLTVLVKKVNLSSQAISVSMPWVDPDPGTKEKTVSAVLAKLFATAKSVRVAEDVLVKPLVAGKGGEVGGGPLIFALNDPFNYKANQQVQFRLYPPGYPAVKEFNSLPVVTFFNGGLTQALDPSWYELVPDPRIPGCLLLKMRMGPTEGVAHFEVTYEGQTSKRLMYNRGGAGAANMPFLFPQGLATGNYQVSFSVSVYAWVLTPDGLITGSYTLPAGSFPTKTIGLKNPQTFAKAIQKELNTAAAAAFQATGIKGSASVTGVDENGFQMTFSGKYGDSSLGGTFLVVITITKI